MWELGLFAFVDEDGRGHVAAYVVGGAAHAYDCDEARYERDAFHRDARSGEDHAERDHAALRDARRAHRGDGRRYHDRDEERRIYLHSVVVCEEYGEDALIERSTVFVHRAAERYDEALDRL